MKEMMILDVDEDDYMIMLFFKQDHRDEYVLPGPGRVTRKTTILMQRVSALAAEEPVPISELSSFTHAVDYLHMETERLER